MTCPSLPARSAGDAKPWEGGDCGRGGGLDSATLGTCTEAVRPASGRGAANWGGGVNRGRELWQGEEGGGLQLDCPWNLVKGIGRWVPCERANDDLVSKGAAAWVRRG